jgi:NAD(P)-dependent dehydrogenase (short-subunit alcohol dehydrogenase family)
VATAVITGAASGVGHATVLRLRRRGWTTVGVDLAAPPADLAADGGVRWVRGSVAEAATWQLTAGEIAAGGEPAASALVFNAAVLHIGSVLTLTEQEWDDHFAVNVRAVFTGLRHLLPAMIEAGGGAVVTVASVDAFMAEQDLAGYCSSKGALLQLTRCVALDHARDGIRANCVAPGVIDTPFFRRHLNTAPDPARWLHEREQRNPIGRLLHPDDVAEVVEFAATTRGPALTGSLLTVDGGLTTGFDYRS